MTTQTKVQLNGIVPVETARMIRVYAALNGLTIGEVIAEMAAKELSNVEALTGGMYEMKKAATL